jgi:hypothetical protein
MTKTLLATPMGLAALFIASAAQAAPALAGHGLPAAAAPGSYEHTLWKQMGTPSGTAFLSETFQSPFDGYDTIAADDFKVPQSDPWTVEEVDVVGAYFNGSGPAESEHVTFYKDAHGLPGAVIADYTVTGTDEGGSFSMRIPKTVIPQGVHWVSVVATMDFNLGSEWGWENQTTVRLNPAVWEEPNGGDCLTWCVQGGPGDEMFVIKGRQRSAN